MCKDRKPIPQGIRFAVLRRDEFACRYCGRGTPEVELHVDHVNPVANEGTDDIGNLVTACSDCNYGKGAKKGILPPKRTDASSLGLVGMYGIEFDDKGVANRAFKVIRRVDEQTYIVELIEWICSTFDGDCEAMSAEHICSKKCKLSDVEAGMWKYWDRFCSREWKELCTQ